MWTGMSVFGSSCDLQQIPDKSTYFVTLIHKSCHSNITKERVKVQRPQQKLTQLTDLYHLTVIVVSPNPTRYIKLTHSI